MRILFDNGTPKPIARSLVGHEISYARRVGWHELGNGELIVKAEEAGYDVLLSTDKNIRYQQNLAHRKIAIVVLTEQQWPNVQPHLSGDDPAHVQQVLDDLRLNARVALDGFQTLFDVLRGRRAA